MKCLRSSRQWIPRLLATLTLGGCERVVSLNLPATSPRLVVEARIERLQVAPSGHQEIVLTTTAPYFSDRTAPAATGAIVRVTDDSGHVVAFVESSSAPGTYVTDQLLASVGRHYTLLIDYEGERYAAVDTLRAVAPIDTLYFEPRHPPDKNPALRATIDVTDPPQAGNDYLWDEYIDGVRARSPDSSAATRAVASDQFQNGTRVKEIQPYDGIPVLPRQLVTMRQMSLSRRRHSVSTPISRTKRAWSDHRLGWRSQMFAATSRI